MGVSTPNNPASAIFSDGIAGFLYKVFFIIVFIQWVGKKGRQALPAALKAKNHIDSPFYGLADFFSAALLMTSRKSSGEIAPGIRVSSTK